MNDIKQEAIDHYDRMIAWAKKQTPRGRVLYTTMELSLNESWMGNYCSYCAIYDKRECDGCTLESKKGCCNGLWLDMSDTLTWKEWVKNAKKVRVYIKKNG